MKIFEYPDVKQVIVSGDIHGEWNLLVYKLCVQYECMDTLLIVAGDCGFGFEMPGFYDQVYNRNAGKLRKANNYVVFVRGNHDDPAYFAEEKVHHARWRCVPDYSVIKAAGHNILCVGGAVSVDRQMRKYENEEKRLLGHKKTAVWWPDEAPEFKPEEIDAIPEDVNIDTVVTHTAPSFCELLTKEGLRSWAKYDSSLISDVTDERKTMDKLLACLKEHGHVINEWIYGHFHQTHVEYIDFIQYCMLDILQFEDV